MTCECGQSESIIRWAFVAATDSNSFAVRFPGDSVDTPITLAALGRNVSLNFSAGERVWCGRIATGQWFLGGRLNRLD